jgi:ankyrin repeat protein
MEALPLTVEYFAYIGFSVQYLLVQCARYFYDVIFPIQQIDGDIHKILLFVSSNVKRAETIFKFPTPKSLEVKQAFESLNNLRQLNAHEYSVTPLELLPILPQLRNLMESLTEVNPEFDVVLDTLTDIESKIYPPDLQPLSPGFTVFPSKIGALNNQPSELDPKEKYLYLMFQACKFHARRSTEFSASEKHFRAVRNKIEHELYPYQESINQIVDNIVACTEGLSESKILECLQRWLDFCSNPTFSKPLVVVTENRYNFFSVHGILKAKQLSAKRDAEMVIEEYLLQERFIGVRGISGCGKSTLVFNAIRNYHQARLQHDFTLVSLCFSMKWNRCTTLALEFQRYLQYFRSGAARLADTDFDEASMEDVFGFLQQLIEQLNEIRVNWVIILDDLNEDSVIQEFEKWIAKTIQQSNLTDVPSWSGSIIVCSTFPHICTNSVKWVDIGPITTSELERHQVFRHLVINDSVRRQVVEYMVWLGNQERGLFDIAGLVRYMLSLKTGNYSKQLLEHIKKSFRVRYGLPPLGNLNNAALECLLLFTKCIDTDWKSKSQIQIPVPRTYLEELQFSEEDIGAVLDFLSVRNKEQIEEFELHESLVYDANRLATKIGNLGIRFPSRARKERLRDAIIYLSSARTRMIYKPLLKRTRKFLKENIAKKFDPQIKIDAINQDDIFDEFGSHYAHKAAELGMLDTIKHLGSAALELGNFDGWLPVHSAASEVSGFVCFDYFLTCDPQLIYSTTNSRSTVLHIACDKRNLEMVERIFSCDPDPGYVNYMSDAGSPLMVLVSSDREKTDTDINSEIAKVLSIYKLLLEKGAGLHQLTEAKNTPMHYVCAALSGGNRPEIWALFKELLLGGGEFYHNKNARGYCPYEKMLKRNCSPNQPFEQNHETDLREKVRSGEIGNKAQLLNYLQITHGVSISNSFSSLHV